MWKIVLFVFYQSGVITVAWGQGGCERRIEVLVKKKRKKVFLFFFLGGGGGGGSGRGVGFGGSGWM